MSEKVKSNEDWKQILSKEQYKVLREKRTEPAFTGKYLHNKKDGTYLCAACGNKLFSSKDKFDSGSGWPSFWEPVSKDSVKTQVDKSHNVIRTEITCSSCGSHLGHVFEDRPKPTGLRYCVNSLSLKFEEK